MIKNLIFDFGKVLVDYEYFETLDQIFKTHEQAEEFYHLLIDGKWNENMDRGDSFEETFCKMQQIMPQYKEEIATVAQRFNDFVRGEKEGMIQGMSETPQKAERAPVGTLVDFVDGVEKDNPLDLEIALNEDGRVIVFHDKPFNRELSWFEYDLKQSRLDFVLDNGDVRNAGMRIAPQISKYMQNTYQILTILMDDKTGEARSGRYVALIVHQD